MEHSGSKEYSGNSTVDDEFRYWCFISYRHADNREENRRWASWLHQTIERYEVPADLVGTVNPRGDTIPKRIYPVFRDEESLAADAHLASRIEEALTGSRTMVVICSPRSVESRYVFEETTFYTALGRRDRIIASIVAGEPGDPEQECFPLPIRHVYESDGSVNLNEGPLAADFRLPDGTEGFTSASTYGTSLKGFSGREKKLMVRNYEAHQELMKLKIIAGILDVPLETLRDRDRAHQLQLEKQRAHRLRMWLSAVGLLAVLAVIGGIFALDQSQRAKSALAGEAAQTIIAREKQKEAEAAQLEESKQRAIAVARQKDAEAAQKAEAEQRSIAEAKQREAEAAQKAEAEQRNIAETKQREAELAQQAEAEQRDVAEKERNRALFHAYRATIRLAASMIDRGEIASARTLLLRTEEQSRNWEWAYLISRCGATPRDWSKVRPDGEWLTGKKVRELRTAFEAIDSGEGESTEVAEHLQRIYSGHRTILHSGSWRGGGHMIIFQNQPPTPQFSFWCGMYGNIVKSALSEDGSVVVWETMHGSIRGRKANVWSGDNVGFKSAIATIPERIIPLPNVDDEEENYSNPEDLLDSSYLVYGPNSFGPSSFSAPAKIFWSREQVRFARTEVDNNGRPVLRSHSRKLFTAPIKAEENASSLRYSDSEETLHNAPYFLEEWQVRFAAAFAKLGVERRFCSWARMDETQYVLLEGNGLELWNVDPVKPVLQITEPGEENTMPYAADTDAVQLGKKKRLAGWVNSAEGRVLSVIDLENSKVERILRGPEDRLFVENEMAYTFYTRMFSSPTGKYLCYSAAGRNERDFYVWNTKNGKLLAHWAEGDPEGFGWEPKDKFVAVSDPAGNLTIRKRFGGKLISEYPGIQVEGGFDMPVQYSPDRSRLLISNLIVDADTFEEILLLKPGTSISEDWKHVVSWPDRKTAELSNLSFWFALQGDLKNRQRKNLLLKDRLLLSEISGN